MRKPKAKVTLRRVIRPGDFFFRVEKMVDAITVQYRNHHSEPSKPFTDELRVGQIINETSAKELVDVCQVTVLAHAEPVE